MIRNLISYQLKNKYNDVIEADDTILENTVNAFANVELDLILEVFDINYHNKLKH